MEIYDWLTAMGVTFSGLTSNARASAASRLTTRPRVLNTQAKAIAGLYAAGEVTGEANINGKQALEGTFLGPAVITGRMAVRSALADFAIHGEASPVEKAENGVPNQHTTAHRVSAATNYPHWSKGLA